ncbi:MAG: tRNA (adenosine(37)-N6)-threonylcarbamoyltransferase complex transferase subunit TsaD [Clostridia bacterium]|nr:tRNA (adenosine(37)-N6)-threonylcarbamoyltransferase complex transferase subunit TsaD [Clostridia bacterium]
MLGLVIESSCDETSVAVLKNDREVLSNIVSSQIDIHKLYGGVVPEIASRNHVKNISYVARQALDEAKVEFEDLDYIGVTYGPGLVGALLVGVSYAKALAYALDIPIVPVHHIEGHIAANYLTNKELKPPFMSLVVSGGHTHLAYVKDYTDIEVIAKTRDDAIGEAFDKVARVLGLNYPGGPEVSKLAENGNDTYTLPKTKFENYDFSFSGIKTAVINLANKEKENLRREDLAKSFEKNVCDTVVEHAYSAMKDLGVNKIALAGGVAANKYLRSKLFEEAKKNHFEAYMPEIKYCTDNAAMIACAAYYNYTCEKDKKKFDIHNNLELNAIASLKLDKK